MEKRNYDQRLWLGIGAIILGILFLASNFHILDYSIRRYIFRWEVLLMFLGVVFFFGRRKRSTGIILFFIGAIFYLRDYFAYSFTFWQIFWPGVLIFAGLMIIFRHRLDRNKKKKRGFFFFFVGPGGTLAVISYHSGEDRLVKGAFRWWSAGCTCPPGLPQCICGQVPLGRSVPRKAVIADDAETRANSRARSARLRFFRNSDASDQSPTRAG